MNMSVTSVLPLQRVQSRVRHLLTISGVSIMQQFSFRITGH